MKENLPVMMRSPDKNILKSNIPPKGQQKTRCNMAKSALTILAKSPIPQLEQNLVIGHIRWSRSLGVPQGDVVKAFRIEAHSYQLVADDNQTKARDWSLAAPHHIDAWLGPDDDAHHCVSFMTIALAARGFDPQKDPAFAQFNYLNVTFRDGLIWKTPIATLKGFKMIQPSQMTYLDVGHAQILADVWVNNVPPSLYL
jgi:hypothetical protein